MPCSETSSPATSTSSSTRIPQTLFITQRAPYEVEKVKTPTQTRPIACTESCLNDPVYTRPPVPVARFLARRGTAKSPQARVPQTPDMPWTATAPIGSSMPIFSTQMTPKTAMKPDPTPMTTPAQAATKPQAALLATRAPSAPFSIIEMSGFPSLSQAMTMPVTAPAAAAMFVVRATYAKKPMPPKSTESVEPGLKPNQPNQRMS